MSAWSLEKLLASLHGEIQKKLETSRENLQHPGTKGDASENIWLDLFRTYLPLRYQVATAHIVDSEGEFSEQIDVVIYDRQYTPLIFHFEGKTIIPAESVYAVFEVKQVINSSLVKYAQKKIASVRKLHRTSLPIPSAQGTSPPKEISTIYGGLLALESEWKPALGTALSKAIRKGKEEEKIDFGCVAAHGYFYLDRKTDVYKIIPGGKPTTAFLLRLISQLQTVATVPMIDIQSYAKWLPE